MLFLCTGNSARSQMAEAILRRHAGDRFNVHSAGLIPKPIHPLALQVMEEAGYDLSRHTSKGVKEYLGMKNFAFVISVCPRTAQDCPRIFPNASNILSWPFDDPADPSTPEAKSLAKFRLVHDQIQAQITTWLEGSPIAGSPTVDVVSSRLLAFPQQKQFPPGPQGVTLTVCPAGQ